MRRLAVAVGVAVALCTGCGIAGADTGSRDSAPGVDSAAGAADPAPARSGRLQGGGPRGPRVARAAGPGASGPPRPAAAANDETATVAPAPERGIGRVGARSSSVRAPEIAETVTVDPAPEPPPPAAAVPPAAAPAAIDVPTPTAPANAGQPASAQTAGTAQSAVPARAASAPTPTPTPSVPGLMSPTAPLATGTVAGLALTNVAQFAMLLALSVLSAVPPGPFSAIPTLRLNGFDLVPASTEEITGIYGRWAYMPGTPGLIQSRQTFGVVDPKTGQQVGAFDALVGRGNGIGYTQLLVTSARESTATAGVPPAGSVISNLQFGLIGLSYSAVPTPSGDKVSFKITTPFGDIPVRIPFDYAKGIADRTVDNRPMQLGNGYSIAPAEPDGETLTAITGFIPGFSTVQGHQRFSVYDPNGRPVGSFEGVFTTTADLFFYTQAVMVTGNDGGNVGVEPGQVPPVGSVYNITYFGTDEHFLLYSALPAPGGPVISVIKVNKGKVTSSALTLIDATTPPVTTLSGAGGFTFVPVSEFLPTGVNGLPPREVQVQGYQRFDVFDPAGGRIGTVDADVFKQWDGFGIDSTALLVTRVAAGGDGVPPAGSMFNFVGSGASRFGAVHSTVPWPSGDLTSFALKTPWGDVRLPSTTVPVTRRIPVVFDGPFRSA